MHRGGTGENQLIALVWRFKLNRRMIGLAAMLLFGTSALAANKPVTVMLKDAMGKDVGTAKLSDGPGGKGVKIALALKNSSTGEHAIHIDHTAKCQAPAF